MQEAIRFPSEHFAIRDKADIAIYVADLKTNELLFLNQYARERWGPEFRARRCREYLSTSGTESCPFCNIHNLLDAAGRPKGVYRWEFHDPETDEWFDCSDEVVEWSDGRLVHMEIAVNITERRRAEQTLEASEQFNRSIIQSSHDCIKIVDPDGTLRYMNEAGQRLLEIDDISSYLGTSYDDLWRGSHREDCRNARKVALDGKVGRFTGYTPTTTGKPTWWDIVVTKVSGDGTGEAQLLVVSRDITQRKLTEEALKKSQRLLKEAQAYAQIGYWTLESDMNSLTWSEEAFRIVGLQPTSPVSIETLKGIVHKDDLSHVLSSLSRAMTEGREHNVEYRINRGDGAERWVSCIGAPSRDEQGKILRLTGFVQDITERKQSEQTLTEALKDKEVLLREIHHRVKNNLQVVASLLYLQAMHAAEGATVEALKESGRRIQLMAQIHEKLYRSSSLARVRIDSFIRSLIEDMIASYGIDANRIVLETDLENITLDIDQAIPCSQIVSELVSNALKHAFPVDRKGRIDIRMYTEDDRIALCIEDNGVGMPTGKDWQSTGSIGLQVVSALAKQLGGEVEMTTEGGCRFRIAFCRI